MLPGTMLHLYSSNVSYRIHLIDISINLLLILHTCIVGYFIGYLVDILQILADISILCCRYSVHFLLIFGFLEEKKVTYFVCYMK